MAFQVAPNTGRFVRVNPYGFNGPIQRRPLAWNSKLYQTLSIDFSTRKKRVEFC